MRRTIVMFGVLALLVVESCAGGGSPTTSTPSVTTPAPTPATDGTTTSASTTTADASTASTASTDASAASTATSSPPGCDVGDATAIADAAIGLARLESGAVWGPDTGATIFTERTNDAAEFGARLAFDCAERLAQHGSGGAERLALVAWNDVRHAAVIQATDAPSTPYAATIRFQLFLEQPLGEWLEDGFVWAATMAGGESIVIDTSDYSTGVTAKSWQSSVPRFEDLPVTLESEQFAIAALISVGARNVSVAEPAPFGSTIGTVQFNTPLALSAFAVVGPTGSFDAMVPIVPDGESTFSTVDGVEIRSTIGKELGEFDLYETAWSCGAHAWRLYTGFGTPAELLEFTGMLVGSLGC